MSVLIKGAKMPESCFNCPLGVSVNFGVLCCPTHTAISDDNLFDADGRELGRQNWCPLASIPEHGDLIDRDKMKESIRMQSAFLRLMGGKFAEIAETLEKGFLQEIDNAPSVIPAEEDEI